MALAVSVWFPVTPSPSTTAANAHPTSAIRSKPASFINNSMIKQRSICINGTDKRSRFFLATKAIEETQGSSESENAGGQGEEPKPELTELGSEIKKAMEERKAAEKEEGLLDGVAEEIKKIEWPAFGKVLGTTGVVLGVIAGSSVVLLTLNFVLAELSDQLFAGKGVQDFFS
ncbi:preprotein translocase subunit SECE1 [Humulus lupulus]|uniref:preprotein translocase subunit SECE1 n=1 Tax=Humulus lupulus TaxID=3486 RepID=UPI002B40C236|nr:preprotein translocase subunit SECE1 [Humulus lupulus]